MSRSQDSAVINQGSSAENAPGVMTGDKPNLPGNLTDEGIGATDNVADDRIRNATSAT